MALSEVRSLELNDGDVALQIDRHLDASAGEGMFQQVVLSVRLTGEHEHDLALSYVAPAPQWKPTYRIVLDGQRSGKALLQAWAVVDNVSGENWDDVRLSLTAGEPLAFRYDLHSPREVERPDLTGSAVHKRAHVALGERTFDMEDDVASAEPEAEEEKASHEDVVAELSAPAPAPTRAGGGVARERARKRAARRRPEPAEAPAVDAAAMQSTMAAQTRASRMSGLTRFDLQQRVSVPDGSATMVALINEQVAGEQVFVYRPSGSGAGYEHNPYRVVRFRNQTDFALEPGPISIYANGSFVGEGLSEAVGSRELATIPFAVEPRIAVRQRVEPRGEEVQSVKVVRGTLVVDSFQRLVTEWTVQGDGAEPYRVLIRHPRRGGAYELVTPKPGQAGVEELPDAYFVPVELAQGTRQAKIEVIEQTPHRSEVSIWDGRAIALLDTLLAGRNLDEAMRAKFRPLVEKRREMGRIDTEIEGLERQQKALDGRSRETRLSLKAVEKDKQAGELRRKLGARLEEFTREADALGRQVVTLQNRRLELKIELEDLLERL